MSSTAEDRLSLYKKRKQYADTIPPLRKSLSRNTILYNNNSNNSSPTRLLFHGNPQQQRHAETVVYPDSPLFHHLPQDTLSKRSSSTPLSIQVFNISHFGNITNNIFFSRVMPVVLSLLANQHVLCPQSAKRKPTWPLALLIQPISLLKT
jgi:hypothetical protein